MTVSHWQRSASRDTIRADLAIVGAGIAGLSAGLHAQRRGLRVAILERGPMPGVGASTRNAGFLMRGAADNYAFGVGLYGRQRTRALWRWSEENLEGLRSQGLESLPSYRRIPSCLLALEDVEAAELRESATLMAEDGFEVRLIEQGDDTLWTHGGVRIGLENPNDGSVNPRELIEHFASMLGDALHTGCEVFSIEEDGEGVVIHARGMDVRAGRVLLCANADAPLLFPELANVVAPNRGQMLALDAPDVRLDCSYYLNRGAEYLRRADERTIVVGGWRAHFEKDERTREDVTSDDIQSGLQTFAERVLGGRWPVVARWAGVMGFSPSGLPAITPLPGIDPSRGLFCGGFTGHGMSLAYRTTEDAIAVLLGEKSVESDAPLHGVHASAGHG
jgi:glycine/D-amino acid oxidase-like deaminating enzyme